MDPNSYLLSLFFLISSIALTTAQSNCPTDNEFCRCRRNFHRMILQCNNFVDDYLPSFGDSDYILYDVVFREGSKVRIISSGAMEKLNAIQLKLQDLGIETVESGAFKGVGNQLTGLHLDNNIIKSLKQGSLSEMPRLMYLSLSNNLIKEVSPQVFEDLVNLQYLYIFKNNIEYLYSDTFSTLRQIKVLGLHYNHIKFIETNAFDNTPELTELNLLDNYLTSIPVGLFRNLRKLTRLNLAKNFLTRLDYDVFNSLGNVEVIDLGNNQLSSLPSGLFRSSNMPKLKDVYLKYNFIQSVESGLFSGFQNLEFVTFQNNMIDSISPNAFQNLPKLTHLHLYENMLTSVPDIFQQTPTLEDVNFSDNRIERLSPGVFSRLNKLIYLYLDGNYITRIEKEHFRGLDSLNQLFLSDNRISTIEDDVLRYIQQLKTMYLQNNEISAVEREQFKGNGLLYLDLGNNKINRIDDRAFESIYHITSLDLHGNLISQINNEMWSNLTKLRDIKLNDNQITDLPNRVFDKLSGSLQRLFLENNKIQRIRSGSFYHLRRLEEIDARNNEISTIERGSFEYQKKIQSVNLSKNKLTYSGIQYKAFEDLGVEEGGIQDLQLGENRLTRFDKSQLDERMFDSLINLNISYNPLNCNCDLAWLRGFSALNKTRWITGCERPSYYRGYLAVCYPVDSCNNRVVPFNSTRDGCRVSDRATPIPDITTTTIAPTSMKTPPADIKVPPRPTRSQDTTSTTRTTTTKRPTTTTTTTRRPTTTTTKRPTTTTKRPTTTSTTPTTTSSTTTSTTTPKPTTSTTPAPVSIIVGYKFEKTDKFSTVYVGKKGTNKIFLPQIQFDSTARLISLTAYVARAGSPFEIQIWKEEEKAGLFWSQRTCRLLYKYQWINSSKEGPIQVNFPGPNDDNCIAVSKGDVIGIMSQGDFMPIGHKWDTSAIRNPLAYNVKNSIPHITDTEGFMGYPLPYRYGIYAEITKDSPCQRSVI